MKMKNMKDKRPYPVQYFPLFNRALLSPILSGSPYPNYQRYKSRMKWFKRFMPMVDMVKCRKRFQRETYKIRMNKTIGKI